MCRTTRRTKLLFLGVFFVFSVVAVSAADPGAHPGTPQLQDAPPGSASAAQDGDNAGSISSPAGGLDVHSILADQSHVMGGSDDSTDGDDNKDNATNGQKDGQKKPPGGGHHGQCVTACATKSTEGAGCGKDLSKPDCFCKSQDFVQQTFACVNATCPQQFHGAAGVVLSICAVAGAPDLTIPGYQGSNNLEHMPTVNDDKDDKKDTDKDDHQPPNNPTSPTTTPTTPASSPNQASTATTVVTVPPGPQTPTSGSSTSNAPGSAGKPASSSAASHSAAGAVAFVTTAALLASVGVWTLF